MRLVPIGFRQVEIALTKWKLVELARLKAMLDHSDGIVLFDLPSAPTLVPDTLETITEEEFFKGL